MMASGSPPSASITSKTVLAIFVEMVWSAIRVISRATDSGETGAFPKPRCA